MEDATKRILDLSFRWQNRALWKVAADALRGAIEKANEADRHYSSAQYMAERGHDASIWDRNAEQAARWSEHRQKHYENCVNELCELANLVREHRPELLEFVPEINVEQEPTGAILNLKRLEGRLIAGQHGDNKPGPEWAERSDVRERYFAVWAFCQKLGNSGLTPNAITTKLKLIAPKLKLSKGAVYKILNETRPPTDDEIEEHRKQANKR